MFSHLKYRHWKKHIDKYHKTYQTPYGIKPKALKINIFWTSYILQQQKKKIVDGKSIRGKKIIFTLIFILFFEENSTLFIGYIYRDMKKITFLYET